ncbi:TMP-TENI-domain-containing protein, partial [Fistulina hepatica ATCC 64428]
ALIGGVTIVQIRQKDADTGGTINDRIDIALAIGAHGVHVGQKDMPVATARRLLPENSIVGVSCNTESEARAAALDGADYIG